MNTTTNEATTAPVSSEQFVDPITGNGLPANLEEMTEYQLGRLANYYGRRGAAEAWKIGRIAELAKAKCKRGQFDVWRMTHLPFISQPTLSRYRKLSKEMTF